MLFDRIGVVKIPLVKSKRPLTMTKKMGFREMVLVINKQTK